jgi:dTDP-4-amino-4,6-dideoxygalactose transaminase
LGYNCRLDEIRAALGIAQLGKLASGNARRRALTQRYWASLANSPLSLPMRDVPGQSACHILPVLLPPAADRQHFMEHLRESGIQTSIHYPPVHEFQYYRQHYPNVSLPKTECLARHLVTLPLYPAMTDDDVDAVVADVRTALAAARVYREPIGQG